MSTEAQEIVICLVDTALVIVTLVLRSGDDDGC